MNNLRTRRAVLAGAGYAVAGSSMMAQWLSVASAAEAGDAAICLTMMYMHNRKQKFDAQYFRSNHLPLLRRVYGDSVEYIELRVADKPEKGAPDQPVQAVFNMWIADVKAFGAKTAAAGAEVQADLAKATDMKPVLEYDKTVALIGSARSEVSTNTVCISTYYQDKEGATFDAKYYLSNVLPKMLDLYGKKAVQRTEFCLGSTAQGGGRPAMLASTHLYFRNVQDYMMAARRVMTEIGPETPNFTTARPLTANLRVNASA
ncbi:MAG: EthD family reductase [Steroidobacteraceae bacterium]